MQRTACAVASVHDAVTVGADVLVLLQVTAAVGAVQHLHLARLDLGDPRELAAHTPNLGIGLEITDIVLAVAVFAGDQHGDARE